MTSTVKLYGPPGTGKTTALTAQGVRSISQYGPDRVCAITFTRTAADELKQRFAVAVGLKPPTDPWARRKFFNERFPWVGTIHSLSLKMTGGKVLSQDDMRTFVTQLGGTPNGLPDLEDLEGYAWAEPGRDEVAAALAIWSAARHRQIPVADAFDLVPWDPRGPTLDLDRCEHIIKQYEDFKRQTQRIDFEDMLERGRHEVLPVDVVLADEVQDNSPLLWQVVDAWSRDRDAALAGDPYQALYLFSGAKPELFIDHPGKLISLGDSRRLTSGAAERAQWILKDAGYTEGEWLGTWGGVGAGEITDGSEFWLARTARLLGPVFRMLEDAGIPYGYVRGGGPLETRAADAFRSLVQLRESGAITAYAANIVANQAGAGTLPRGVKAQLDRLAKSDPEALVEASTFGTTDADMLGIRHAEYYERVLGNEGIQAFVYPPRCRVGTIHAAKGREADTVHLIDSWGTLPYRNLDTTQGRRAEACVAYVAVTRHRSDLVMEPSFEGTPYPGF